MAEGELLMPSENVCSASLREMDAVTGGDDGVARQVGHVVSYHVPLELKQDFKQYFFYKRRF